MLGLCRTDKQSPPLPFKRMHLQQTKRGSIKSGGPQYYFHDLTDPVQTYLRKKGAVRVALVTPYGATKSDFFAVGKDHKLATDGMIAAGRVGHDRIQQGKVTESIGEAIRHWYRLKTGDYERIDVDVHIHEDILVSFTASTCSIASSLKLGGQGRWAPWTFRERLSLI